jgi:hypothetical protein
MKTQGSSKNKKGARTGFQCNPSSVDIAYVGTEKLHASRICKVVSIRTLGGRGEMRHFKTSGASWITSSERLGSCNTTGKRRASSRGINPPRISTFVTPLRCLISSTNATNCAIEITDTVIYTSIILLSVPSRRRTYRDCISRALVRHSSSGDAFQTRRMVPCLYESSRNWFWSF